MKLAKYLLPCLLALASHTTVKADGGDLAMAYLFGYSGFGGARFQTYQATPPYFAMHPPVYYGQRYTRPYGASPFAAWPQLQSNPTYAPQPHVNRWQPFSVPSCPHCMTGAATGSHGIAQVAPVQPLEIDNPYYTPEAVYTSTK